MLTLAILAMSAAQASAQTAPMPAVKPLPMGALEHYDNPPAQFRFQAVSPQAVSQLGEFISYQVNVSAGGSNIVGDAANEPSICVDPANRLKMAIGWRQFDDVTSNFRKAGRAYTTNGGANWTNPGPLNNVFRSDPVLAIDSSSQFYYLSLLTTFFDDLWRSLNGGQSWIRLASADGGDKQWFVIDNTNSTGHGFQYQIWSPGDATGAGNNYNGRQFTRSLDGGSSWMNPINIPHQPGYATLDVDGNGNVFIGGVDVGNQLWCVRSSNAKNSTLTPTFDQSTAVNLGGTVNYGDIINPEGLTGQVWLAADRSGTSTNNNVYMLASVRPTGASNGADVMFARSTDGGHTFSAPVRINDDPVNHNKWHWFGALAVAPNGRLDVVWLDSRNAANNTNSQLFYSWSADGGKSWAPNMAVSQAFNPFLGYPNQNKIGDYLTIVSDNGGGNVAYAATFNGEQDVYYVRVVPPPPIAITAVARSGSTFTIHGLTAPGTAVHIQASNSPGSGFSGSIGSATADNAGVFKFNDATALTQRFYRVIYP